MEEQDLEVRTAFPVCWGMLAGYGMRVDTMLTLLPADLLESAPEKSDHVIVPQRILGALRRQLDRMAALWDAQSGLLVLTDVQEGASALLAEVMDEDKRAKRPRSSPAA
jgi:hypothetical protein